MQQINVYKLHSKQALKNKIVELRENGHHAFSVAASIGDAGDWHGGPTYLLDSPVGYSTRPANAIKPYLNQYNIIDVEDGSDD